MYSLQKLKGLEPTKTWQRRLPDQYSASAATAQKFYIDLPRDHFIHKIIIAISESSSKAFDPSNLADDIVNIQLVGNGNKYIKDMTGAMCKQVMKLNKEKPATGFYVLYFSDPKIPIAKPLPAWVFTSLQLIIEDNAPASGQYHTVHVTLVESAYQGEDITDWHILIEKYLRWAKFGSNTGWQRYEHERAYEVFGYLYCMDDNGTLSDTVFDKLKLLARTKEKEITIISEVPISVIKAENNAEISVDTLDTGFFALEWVDGFPTHEFTSLYSYLNIPSAGTNVGLRVLERYVL